MNATALSPVSTEVIVGALEKSGRRRANKVAEATNLAGVPLMQPLMISKVNTVFQISLLAGCMGQAFSYSTVSRVVTAGTTAASCIAYAHKFINSGYRSV